jgi:hypothetical protein
MGNIEWFCVWIEAMDLGQGASRSERVFVSGQW